MQAEDLSFLKKALYAISPGSNPFKSTFKIF